MARRQQDRPTTDTTAAIQAAALAILHEDGIVALTKTALARRAGISKQLVQYHVPDVNTLLVSLYQELGQRGQRITDEYLAQLGSRAPPEAGLAAMIDAAFTWVTEDERHGTFFLLMYHGAATVAPLNAVHEVILATGLRRIEILLASGKTPLVRTHRQRTVMATALHSALIGCLVRMVSRRAFAEAPLYREAAYVTFGSLTQRQRKFAELRGKSSRA